MADGKIVFSTKIDNSQVANDLKQLEKKIRQSEEAIAKAENEKLPLVKQLDEAKKKLDSAKKSLADFKADLAATQVATKSQDPVEATAATAALPEAQAMVDAQKREVESLQKNWETINSKVEGYNSKIQQANIDIDRNKAKARDLADQLNSNSAKMQDALDKARASAEKFRKKIIAVGASMIMFRLFSAIINGVSKYMNRILKTNEEYTAQLAQLKAALMTAFQPIYEFVLPGLMAVLRVLTSIVMVVANVLSAFAGKTVAQSAKNAEALNKEADALENVGGAAKDAGKSLANFDEINTLSTGESGGGGAGGSGGKYDFKEFDTAEYKAKIDELTVYLSGALLAIGAILAFSGANIPLGIALMAAGALGIVSVIKENWGKMSDKLKGAIAQVMFILGGALLVIGAVLTFSGANIPLGIALMVAGASTMIGTAIMNWNAISDMLRGPLGVVIGLVSAALLGLGAILAFSGVAIKLGIALMAAGAIGLVSVVAVNWDGFVNTLRGPIGAVMALAGASLLAIGLILALSGINPALGIAMMIAGGAALVAVTAVNWNYIRDTLAEAWQAIKQWYNENVAPVLTLEWWTTAFSNIGTALSEAFKGAINAVTELWNNFVDGVNQSAFIKWRTQYLEGKKLIDAGSIQFASMTHIPFLAQGAVLPANKPFMAMVGDQKNGTNIEAPLATIQEALANVLATQGSGDINITFTGDLAQLARVLKPVIDRENNRVGGSLAKGAL